jgi:hypothetical protein
MVLLSRLDCVDVLGVEDGIEAGGELGVRVSDEESERQADRVQVEEVDGKEIGTRSGMTTRGNLYIVPWHAEGSSHLRRAVRAEAGGGSAD